MLWKPHDWWWLRWWHRCQKGKTWIFVNACVDRRDLWWLCIVHSSQEYKLFIVLSCIVNYKIAAYSKCKLAGCICHVLHLVDNMSFCLYWLIFESYCMLCVSYRCHLICVGLSRTRLLICIWIILNWFTCGICCFNSYYKKRDTFLDFFTYCDQKQTELSPVYSSRYLQAYSFRIFFYRRYENIDLGHFYWFFRQ